MQILRQAEVAATHKMAELCGKCYAIHYYTYLVFFRVYCHKLFDFFITYLLIYIFQVCIN